MMEETLARTVAEARQLEAMMAVLGAVLVGCDAYSRALESRLTRAASLVVVVVKARPAFRSTHRSHRTSHRADNTPLTCRRVKGLRHQPLPRRFNLSLPEFWEEFGEPSPHLPLY